MKLIGGGIRAAKIVFGSGLASVFLLASNIVLARVLSPASYGDYTVAFTLSNGGMFIASFGLTQLLLQEYGRKQHFASGFARASLIIQLVATVVSCFAIVALSYVLHLTLQARNLTALLLPVMVAQSVGDIGSVYFQLTRRLWLSGGWIAILNALRFICSLLFIATTRDIYMLALYQSAVAVVFVATSILLTLRMFSIYSASEISTEFSVWSSIRQVARDSSPYAVANVMYFAVSQLPIVLFAAIAGSHQAAIYSVAFLILSTLYFVPQTLMIRYLMLRYHALVSSDRKSVDFLYRQGTRLAAAAGLAIAAISYFLIPTVVTHLFGGKYDESIRLLRIMIICVPLRFMTVNLAAIVVSGISIWHKNFADFASGGFAIVCFSALIWLYGGAGGAYAAVLTEIVILLSHYYLVERYIYQRHVRGIIRHWLKSESPSS